MGDARPLFERWASVFDQAAGDLSCACMAHTSARVALDMDEEETAFKDGWRPSPELRQRVEALGVRDQAPQPIVMGRHLIELGWDPGKHFRSVLDACFEAQLDGVFDNVKNGRAFLRQLLNVEPVCV